MFKAIPIVTLSALFLGLAVAATFSQSAQATERDFIHFERMRSRYESMHRPELERKPAQGQEKFEPVQEALNDQEHQAIES